MQYKVSVENIAMDIDDRVRAAILKRLETYDFPYATAISYKKALRDIFRRYFIERQTMNWLKNELSRIAPNRRGVLQIVMTEPNRLHTGGLADVLLSEGKTQCTTIHNYEDGAMSPKCKNIDGKVLDIKEILENSFPKSVSDLNRDVPMIPQHVSCRHVMAPLENNMLRNQPPKNQIVI